MLPNGLEQAEYRILCQAIQDACGLHAHGDAWAGYRCLTEGLERARSLAADGNPWADDLARSYLTALEEYSAVVGRPMVVFDGQTTTVPAWLLSAQPDLGSDQGLRYSRL